MRWIRAPECRRLVRRRLGEQNPKLGFRIIGYRLSDALDAGQDKVDAGKKLLSVVVPWQFRR